MAVTRTRIVGAALLVLVSSGCGTSAPGRTVPTDVRERVAAISDAVDRWASAPDLAHARAAAEEAANLVTGPGVAGYGDRDGDGVVRGAVDVGLLPGEDGSGGLATRVGGHCLDAHVLGGSWSDPVGRWRELADAVAGWRPDVNTFPALASHPQRIVGWANLTLAAGTLAEAVEYGGHATLHAGVTAQALSDC